MLPRAFTLRVNGGDAAILFRFIFLYLVAAGAGAFSLEHLLRHSTTTAGRYART